MISVRFSLRLMRWLLAAAGVMLALKIVYGAGTEGYFVDEVVNAQAIVNLYKKGNYTSNIIGGLFPPEISSGVASTWLNGLAWVAGADLFTVRLAAGFFYFLQVMLLVFFWARRCGWERTAALGFGVILMSVVVYVMPYNFGFIRGLGELQGALLIGWALLMMDLPPMAFLLLGAAVWGCKFMYLPAAVLLGGAILLSGKHGSAAGLLKTAVVGAVMFFLPLAVWLLLIVSCHGMDAMVSWLGHFRNFILDGNSGVAGSGGVQGLMPRLKSPQLEWSGLSLWMQARIVIFYVLALAVSLVMFMLPARRGMFRRSALLTAAVLAAVTVFYGWYFWKSPTMWVRHLQPGMYLALGLAAGVMVGHLIRYLPRGLVYPLMSVCLFFLVCFQSLKLRGEWPVISGAGAYARHCSDIFSTSCDQPG